MVMTVGNIHELYGVFFKGELEAVEFTTDDAKHSALMLSQVDGAGPIKHPVHRDRMIRPVFVLETDLRSHFYQGAVEYLKVAQKEFQSAEAEQQKMIDTAVAEQKPLPDHYWDRKYKAFLHYEGAKRMVECLKEQITTTKFSFGG